jgi:chromosome segregation ATPase
MLTEQQLSYMNDKIGNLRYQLNGNHDALENAKKTLEDRIHRYGDALNVNGGYQREIKVIKDVIKEREAEVERLARKLTRYEVALKNNKYIEDIED